ncbi:MAG: hypothetical protein JWP11_625 [Frankiales bacterium]|jgi:hypothetical protein|nr:hypothetical protein [Frankiales bacterium]
MAGLALAASSQLPAGATVTGSKTAPEKTVTLPATPGKSVVTYKGHAPFNNDSAGIAADNPLSPCDPTKGDTFNDQHFIKINVPAGMDDRYDTLIRFQIDWTFTGNEAAADMALHLYGPDGKQVAESDGSQASEGINLTDKAPGVYDVLVCAFQTGPTGQDYTGTVTAQTLAPGTFPAAKGVTPPKFQQYEAPKGLATGAGEPSIGNNWKSGNTLFTAYTDEYVVKFGAGTSSTWTLVNDDVVDASNKISLDPIGYTDSETGRTFVSQLLFACSGSAYSDDDFSTQAVPSQGCGSVVNGFDHQTFGGGPFPEGAIPGATVYPHAVYYCSQAPGLVTPGATCSRSDDGGLTFGPSIIIYDGTQCSGIHGHVRVGPKGTVYVPNVKCGGNQGLAVSKDGGLTWNVYHVPDSIEGTSDPSVSAGKDGTVYFGYGDGTGKPRIAMSTDEGKTWTKSVDVGIPFGIKNTEFSEVIAGDGNRAAFAFLGTPTRGSTQAASFGKSADGKTFTGAEWHMYVATTYDRGKTWTTVDATPKDPVQRGCIWNSGGSNPCRNLLDFNDITLDKTGHLLIGFADGCVPASVEPKGDAPGAAANDCVASKAVSSNGLVQHGAILRQISGKGLFAAYDSTAAVPVAAPPASGGGTPSSSGSGSGAPSSGGNLAATGGLPAAGAGLLLLLLGLAAHRRRTA